MTEGREQVPGMVEIERDGKYLLGNFRRQMENLEIVFVRIHAERRMEGGPAMIAHIHRRKYRKQEEFDPVPVNTFKQMRIGQSASA